MPNKREDLEEQILGQMQEAVRKMLDGLPDRSTITLSDMEKAIGVLGQEISQQTLQCLLESQSPANAGEVTCEKCGMNMQRRGKRKKRVVTLRGEVEVEREYYVCPECGTGHFPPG